MVVSRGAVANNSISKLPVLDYLARLYFSELFFETLGIAEYFEAIADEARLAAELHPHPGNRWLESQLLELEREAYVKRVVVVVGYWEEGISRKIPVSNSLLVRWHPGRKARSAWEARLRCRIHWTPSIFAAVLQDEELRLSSGTLSYLTW